MMLMMTVSRHLYRFCLNLNNVPTVRFTSAQLALTTENIPATPAKVTDTAVKPIKLSKPKKLRTKKAKLSQELLSYISQNSGTQASNILQQLPPKYGKIGTSIPTSVYLIDQSVASRIADLILETNPDLEAPAIEYNAGLGLLTSKLIQLGFKNLSCFEDQAKLAKKLKESYNIPIIQKNFIDLPRLLHVDRVDGGHRVTTLLSQVKVPQRPEVADQKEKLKKNLHVFGSFPHLSSINFTIKNLVTQTLLYEDDWDWNDPIYYIALGSKAYWILNSSPTSGFFSYRPSAVLFQLLFKSKLLGIVPRKAYIPWVNESVEGKSNKFKARNNFDPELVYILKIETNTDLVEKLGRDQLFPFWYFVRQHLFSRKKPIIPQLEQWIPGCGTKLIRQGFTIYDHFGQLTPKEILNIYLEFVSWPEFASSSFLTAVDKFHSRIETQEDDDLDFTKSH